MWAARYWSPRYWTSRYWTRRSVSAPAVDCLVVDRSIRFKYGTGRHWGTEWKWGGGTVSDPYLPTCGDPCTVPRFQLETYPMAGASIEHTSQLMWIDSGDALRIRRSLILPDEVYWLQQPGGQWWEITITASTGMMQRSPVALPGGMDGMSVDDPGVGLWVFGVDASGALFRRREGQIIYVLGDLTLLRLYQGNLVGQYGAYPDEVFYLVAPNGTPYQVTFDGLTGDLTYIDNVSGSPVGKTLLDEAGVMWRFMIDNNAIVSLVSEDTTSEDGAIVPTFTEEHCI